MSIATQTALTPRQQAIYDLLAERQRRGESPLTIAALCRHFGLASRGAMHKHITALADAGLIQPVNGQRRGIVVVLKKESAQANLVPMLGTIAAGKPLETLTNPEPVDVPHTLLQHAGRHYVLRVRGDSMRDESILDGDWVIIAADLTPKTNDIVVALIDNQEATLKHWRRQGDQVQLIPANPDHPIQTYADERVTLQGVVTGIIRHLKS